MKQSLFFLFLAMSFFVKAQDKTLDSLLQQLKNMELKKSYLTDTSYINTLAALAKAYNDYNPDTSLIISNQVIRLSDKIKYQKGKADGLKDIGISYFIKANLIQSLDYYQQSLKIAEESGYEQILAAVYNNIGQIYFLQKQHNLALTYYLKSLKIDERQNNQISIALDLNNIGAAYLELNNYDLALKYQQKSLEIQLKINDQLGMADSYQNMGNVYQALKKNNLAIEYFQKSIDISQKITNNFEIIHPLLGLAKVYFETKEYPFAKKYALQAIDFGKKLKANKQIQECTEILYKIFKEENNRERALYYHELFKSYTDSIYNIETSRKINELEASHQYENQTLSLKNEAITNEKQIFQQKVLIYILSGGLVFILLTIYLMYQIYGSEKKNKKILLEKNEEISVQANKLEEAHKELVIQNNQIFDHNNQLKAINQKILANQGILKKAYFKIKEDEQRLKGYTHNIEALNHTKDQLFSIIAHDLRGPLISINELFKFLEEGTIDLAEFEMMLPKMSKNINYTLNLTENLLAWAESQLDGATVTPEYFKLFPIIENYRILFQNQIQKKNLQFINEIPIQITLWADKNMIELVFRNLINNAIKFCKNEGQIQLTTEEKSDFCQFCIEDTGIGMSAEMTDIIFTKARISTLGTHREKGTGLGLKICKEFIEKNGGSIWVESKENMGSKFFVKIPKNNQHL
jgi:two-component system, sensor histidine kinase and response regulator